VEKISTDYNRTTCAKRDVAPLNLSVYVETDEMREIDERVKNSCRRVK